MATATSSTRSRSNVDLDKTEWYTDELEPVTQFCEKLSKDCDKVVSLIPCKRDGRFYLCIVTEGGEFTRPLPRLTNKAAAKVAAAFLRRIANQFEKAAT